MIPISLTLKNFLSYGAQDQHINFEPHHLIYLSGKNGHGKSALLDAMTWALWGIARKITNAVKPDVGLLRLGATQMVVVFDFELNKQRYRVKREFMQTAGKQLAYLEFGILLPDGSINSLTDKTIRATQAVIDKTIRLDYESFVNTAFLRQGHANEFCRKSPKDRKEILGTILGLHQFDLLKKRALDANRLAVQERQSLQAVMQSLKEQAPNEKQLQERAAAIQKKVAEIKKQYVEYQKHTADLDSEYRKIEADQKKIEIEKEKYLALEQEYQLQLSTMTKLFQEWRSVHKRTLQQIDVKKLELQKEQATDMIRKQQAAMQKKLLLQTNLLQVKERLQTAESQIEKQLQESLKKQEVEIERLKVLIEAGAKQIGSIEQEKKLLLMEQAKEENNNLTYIDADSKKESVVKQFEKRKEFYHRIAAKLNWVNSEIETVDSRMAIAQGGDSSCPTCEQNLTAARRKFLANRFLKRRSMLLHQKNRLSAIVIKLKTILIEQHKRIEYLSKRDELEQKINGLNKKVIDLRKEKESYKKNCIKHEKDLAVFVEKKRKELEDNFKLEHHRTLLSKVEKEILAVQFDEKLYQSMNIELQAVEKQLKNLLELKKAIETQESRKREVNSFVTLLKQLKSRMKKSSFKQKREKISLAQIKLNEKKSGLEVTSKQIQKQKEAVREEYGRVKSEQELLLKLEAEHQKQTKAVANLNAQIDDYQQIIAAAGKDGVQAILIEQAIPEIEQEANELLSKLTNNQSHIAFESLRDLKRGGSKETLDINISDPSGIRPYEMFSGGEAFRIDFAVRIAISKLLARRAGTSLQTLIIDEGFGSQDEEGLSLIMDAIYRIQEDFQKVIVVSHLPAMKDQFPVHFVVDKVAQGSQISVIEQG